MKINENSDVEWTEKVESTSSVRDPLGLWSHLNIQVDYVPGITSVTNRIRYYSLLAYYYENLFDQRILTHKDWERLFILTCLSHHKGDHGHPSLGNVFNKQRFKDDWNDHKTFKLNFLINGFGRTYYNRQLDIMRCCWTDQLNQIHKSPINSALANSFPSIDEDFTKQKQFTREEVLENLSEFCICKKYPGEIDVMTKLLFGFMRNKGNEWYIDEESYKQFMEKGELDLDFKGFEVDTEEIILTNAPVYQEMSQRRRNTLFMFLKIIAETNPKRSEMHKAIWDAIYFKQNNTNSENINFNGLDKVMKFWELLQLNIYFVYSLEKIFDVIQEIVFDDNGINKEKLLESLDINSILDILKTISKIDVNADSKIEIVIQAIQSPSEEGLKSEINESKLYDNISSTDKLEEIVANVFAMIALLKRRFGTIDKRIIDEARIEKDLYIQDKLRIDKLFEYLDENKDQGILSFLKYLVNSIIERHLYEANVRMSWGTKNWLFVEEDSRLFFSKKDLIRIHSRDNRWHSIMTLMQDIEMIKVDDKVSLTDKGKQWLQQAKLI